MLLRGVKFPEPALDYGDIQAVKSKAQSSGRSFGGAPFRGNNGGNRGGRINYASQERPNPFAAHLDPNFKPAGNPAPSGWVPPMPGSTGYSRGPPPPPRGGGMSGYSDGRQQYQNRGAYGGPPPRQNYGRDDYYGGYQQPPSNYRGRGGGYSRGGSSSRDSYGSRNQGGYGRY